MQVTTSRDIRIYKDRWPKGAIVYQIYPRSWQDSNGDGIGDIPGITTRLPYLQELGINGIWLSPFYPSPMVDFGYDISDYCNVDPRFGTLEDFKTMLNEAHQRGIKVLVDLVPNHTSDEHPWFQASRRSRHNAYANWYVWHSGKTNPNGGQPLPPNNWRDALTGGSAWEWVADRQQYYLHSFHKKQPDLNWENPAVAEAMIAVMRFWLNLGVDGFRVDAVYFMAKDPTFSDDPLSPQQTGIPHAPRNSLGWPKVYQHLSKMAATLKEASEDGQRRFMVTEAYPHGRDSLQAYMEFYDGVDTSVAAPFNFDGLLLAWSATAWRTSLQAFHQALEDRNTHAIASYAFGNHDRSRLVSRLGENQARAAALLQLTLPGMSFIYYGEEIGMENVTIPPALKQDPANKNDGHAGDNRDAERTPMQWNATPNAGFTEGTSPWLPLANDFTTNNVEAQKRDIHSFYNLYKSLCSIRNKYDVIAYGSLQVIDTDNEHLLIFIRSLDQEQTLTVVNFSDEKVVFQPPVALHKCLVSSCPQSALPDASAEQAEISLLPHEAALFLVAH